MSFLVWSGTPLPPHRDEVHAPPRGRPRVVRQRDAAAGAARLPVAPHRLRHRQHPRAAAAARSGCSAAIPYVQSPSSMRNAPTRWHCAPSAASSASLPPI
eukprot:1291728-Pleurochrysis_carterae.AAC.3